MGVDLYLENFIFPQSDAMNGFGRMLQTITKPHGADLKDILHLNLQGLEFLNPVGSNAKRNNSWDLKVPT